MNTASPARPVLCRHLRTKKMYVPAQEAEVLEAAMGERPGEPHCWCNRTMNEIGRDGGPVALGRCMASRACFE
jgi:hypothetical protein